MWRMREGALGVLSTSPGPLHQLPRRAPNTDPNLGPKIGA